MSGINCLPSRSDRGRAGRACAEQDYSLHLLPFVCRIPGILCSSSQTRDISAHIAQILLSIPEVIGHQSWRMVGVQYRERVIFLSKPVDEELGNQLVATMLYLDSENKKDMQIYINCSGGEVRRK